MKIFFFVVVLIFIMNLKFCQSLNYTNYILYNVIPVERYQLEFLQNLDKRKYIEVIFWTRPQRVHNDIQILVPYKDFLVFEERLHHFNLNSSVLTRNIQQLFDLQQIRKYTGNQYETFSWDAFYDLKSVYQWMTDIAVKYNDRVNLRVIGESNEGREILAIEITRKNAKRKAIVEGTLHGNEWIATVFVTYLANQLINAENSTNWRLQYVANKYDWFIIPIANPDGYDYSMKVDRMWRKNRKKTGNETIGVDLNSNFDYSFCKYGGSSDINSPYYCGPTAFSEPETLAIYEFVERHKNKLNCYFSFHAYGQKIVIPYSDRVRHIENFLEMENYGKQAILKMYHLYGVKYGVGTIYDLYGYLSSGDSVSWVKKKYKVNYALAFYLRDNGIYGYALPMNSVMPTCEETLIGLLELMTVRHRSVRELYSFAFDLRPRFDVLLFTMTFLFY